MLHNFPYLKVIIKKIILDNGDTLLLGQGRPSFDGPQWLSPSRHPLLHPHPLTAQA